MPRKKKLAGSPVGKLYWWERMYIWSVQVQKLLKLWAVRLAGLLAACISLAADWLLDPKNQEAIKTAMPLIAFAAVVIIAGAIKSLPELKKVKESDNINREKI